MKNVCNAKEALVKNDELYMTSSIFLNYMKRKCTTEMKKYVKIQKKRYKTLIIILTTKIIVINTLVRIHTVKLSHKTLERILTAKMTNSY